jgi:hypothetical protein
MMNVKIATERAKKLGLKVSGNKVIQLDRLTNYGAKVNRHEIKVGSILCFYETDKGGCACWNVEHNGEVIRASYKSGAILLATNLQTSHAK